jgi:hypothetical protein
MRAQSIFFLSTLLAIVPFMNPAPSTGSSELAYRGSGRLEMAYRGSGRLEMAYRGSGRITVS